MLNLQKRLARMQADLEGLTADVASCSEAQQTVHSSLSCAHSGIAELLEEKAQATSAAQEAKSDVDRAQRDLHTAATEVTRSLSRPAPFLSAAGVAVAGGAGAARLPGGLDGDVPCAVVSTLKGIPEAELHTWLSHHLDGCGFSLAFLFFDDPSELACRSDIVRHWGRRLVPVPVDATLQVEYDACQRLLALKGKLCEDWLARQELHVEIAMRWARGKGCQWLLHIDLDELFVLQEGISAPRHFASVDPARGAVAYLNHEGVPELHDEVVVSELSHNRFAATTLFRRNAQCLAEGFGLDEVVLGDGGVDLTLSVPGSPWQRRLDALASSPSASSSSAAVQTFAFWPRRTKAVLGSAQYFLAYSNGKGAVRLSSDALPNTVHRFGETELGRYWCPKEAVVLHYASGCCDAVAEKLRRLRASSGDWWRSFVLYTRGRDSDEEGLRAIYAGALALDDPDEAARQVDTGVCLRYAVADGHLPKWSLCVMD
mmetsp:Transcript_113264/g.366313  ORF Transcript_113264/g.366313 Transcript_113264/m.366313 type:complete len:486 (-) Transcript_113264:22-1479(-)